MTANRMWNPDEQGHKLYIYQNKNRCSDSRKLHCYTSGCICSLETNATTALRNERVIFCKTLKQLLSIHHQHYSRTLFCLWNCPWLEPCSQCQSPRLSPFCREDTIAVGGKVSKWYCCRRHFEVIRNNVNNLAYNAFSATQNVFLTCCWCRTSSFSIEKTNFDTVWVRHKKPRSRTQVH